MRIRPESYEPLARGAMSGSGPASIVDHMEIVSNIVAALSILGTLLVGAMAILPSMLELRSGR